jgi:hypothetical protein
MIVSMNKEIDIYHLKTSQILLILGISSDTLFRHEDMFSELISRDHNNNRYSSIFEICKIYHILWKRKPSKTEMADFLFRIGMENESQIKTLILRLESRDLLK